MIISKITDLKHNWLLFTFFSLFILALVVYLLIDTTALVYNSHSAESTSLRSFLLLAVILAPILEELTFRGLFLSNKKVVTFSFVLITAFSLFSYENYFAITAYILFASVYLVYRKYQAKLLFNLVCILNAVLFGVIHYTMNDFASFEKSFIIIFQIAGGFLLIWVTINFGLFKSILVHATYNAIALSFIVVGVQFPDTTINSYEDEEITVEWQRVPHFNNSGTSILPLPKGVTAYGCSVSFLYMTVGMGYSDEKNNEKVEAIIPAELYMKYDFKIQLKENTSRTKIKKATYNFLLNEGLIAPSEIEK